MFSPGEDPRNPQFIFTYAPTLHTSGIEVVDDIAEEKARAEMAKKAGGKGPLSAGGQGIKKSGKK